MGVGFVSLVLEGVVRWSSLFQKEKDVHIGRQRRDVNKKEPFVARASDCWEPGIQLMSSPSVSW